MPGVPIDCVIFGGGVAGVWILDAIARSGRSVLLLESDELGAGQTVCAQGIIHGGFKYTLRGLLTPSAAAIAEMPQRWRRSLDGAAEPSLVGVRVRAASCVLWQTRSLSSAIGMIGARAGLRVTPTALAAESRPAPLRDAPGTVARLDEQVIDPASMLDVLSSRWRTRIVRIDARHGLEIRTEESTAGRARAAASGPRSGPVRCVSLLQPETGDVLDLAPELVVLAAGVGNERLREACGLDAAVAQRRPLHMTMARGTLPELNGHCVDGARTRVTITSSVDSERRVVWQIGGQIAEDGVELDEPGLISRAVEELSAVLPGTSLDGVAWSTYRVDRAERRVAGRSGHLVAPMRPDDVQLLRDGNVATVWPTKLALAPRLADMTLASAPPASHAFDLERVAGWPRPLVALPPWEWPRRWRSA